MSPYGTEYDETPRVALLQHLHLDAAINRNHPSKFVQPVDTGKYKDHLGFGDDAQSP